MSLKIVLFPSEMIDFQRRDEPQSRAFSSEMIDFQRRDEPQNRAFSSEMIDFQRRLWRQKMTKLKEAARVAGPCRAGSPIHFFDLILNNAPAQARATNDFKIHAPVLENLHSHALRAYVLSVEEPKSGKGSRSRRL